MKLINERSLEDAEATLELWARTLADEGRDRDAADVLRVANDLCRLRCGFLESDKSP